MVFIGTYEVLDYNCNSIKQEIVMKPSISLQFSFIPESICNLKAVWAAVSIKSGSFYGGHYNFVKF